MPLSSPGNSCPRNTSRRGEACPDDPERPLRLRSARVLHQRDTEQPWAPATIRWYDYVARVAAIGRGEFPSPQTQHLAGEFPWVAVYGADA